MYKNKENDFTGLTEEEVKRSREEHGSNKLPDPELTKWWEFALDALKEPITVILIVITIITCAKQENNYNRSDDTGSHNRIDSRGDISNDTSNAKNDSTLGAMSLFS